MLLILSATKTRMEGGIEEHRPRTNGCRCSSHRLPGHPPIQLDHPAGTHHQRIFYTRFHAEIRFAMLQALPVELIVQIAEQVSLQFYHFEAT